MTMSAPVQKENSNTNPELDQLCINTIRFLSADAVQKANSGHPGLPLGAAPMSYVLWNRFLRFNPKDPNRSEEHTSELQSPCNLVCSLLLENKNNRSYPN